MRIIRALMIYNEPFDATGGTRLGYSFTEKRRGPLEELEDALQIDISQQIK
jgi:hypothetical protein